MEDLNTTQNLSNLILDSKLNIIYKGIHNGSIVTKLNDDKDSIIFSDTISIAEDLISLEGLKIGIVGNSAFADKDKFEIQDLSTISYSVKMDDEIVEMFDNARFGLSFPFMISFLNTRLLYYDHNEYAVNHADFVIGEIINHPIALFKDNSILVADRLVVDSLKEMVFYDAFTIDRSGFTSNKDPISFVYEPIYRIEIENLKYVIILGVEVLK